MLNITLFDLLVSGSLLLAFFSALCAHSYTLKRESVKRYRDGLREGWSNGWVNGWLDGNRYRQSKLGGDTNI